ncbi:MAG: ABC-ATPase UvrA, partial [Planctomycetota bacterium]
IEGLQPTIAIDQHAANANPRSTVATTTEIYDYLRLLVARLGVVACPDCGTPIAQQTPTEIESAVANLPPQTKAMILAPMVRGRKGKHAEVMERIRREGFVRVRIDGVVFELEDAPELKPQQRHDIEAVVDRVIVREGLGNRLAESIRLALKHGEGALRVVYLTPEAKARGESPSTRESTPANGWQQRVYSTQYACPDCKVSLVEIEPRTFSFNSPYGACPECEGIGAREGFDPARVLPDRGLSLADGVVAPWRGASAEVRKTQRRSLEPLLQRHRVSWNDPLDEWPAAAQKQLLYGDGERFPGLLTHLEMDYAQAKREATRRKLADFRGSVPCEACHGARLRPEARSCRFAGKAIHEITALTIGEALPFFRGLSFPPNEAAIGEPLAAEIVKRLEFLDRVGVHYLTLDRSADSLSG